MLLDRRAPTILKAFWRFDQPSVFAEDGENPVNIAPLNGVDELGHDRTLSRGVRKGREVAVTAGQFSVERGSSALQRALY